VPEWCDSAGEEVLREV